MQLTSWLRGGRGAGIIGVRHLVELLLDVASFVLSSLARAFGMVGFDGIEAAANAGDAVDEMAELALLQLPRVVLFAPLS